MLTTFMKYLCNALILEHALQVSLFACVDLLPGAFADGVQERGGDRAPLDQALLSWNGPSFLRVGDADVAGYLSCPDRRVDCTASSADPMTAPPATNEASRPVGALCTPVRALALGAVRGLVTIVRQTTGTET